MPLPPAPSKRAALLAHEAYDASARSTPKVPKIGQQVGSELGSAERPLAYDRTKAIHQASTHIAPLNENPAVGGNAPRGAASGPGTSELVAQNQSAEITPSAAKPKKRKATGLAKLFVP